LDNLYQILVENPSFIIELSSHTDGIGSDEGNMKLSQARAESCVAYLISKGITKDRLVARGYGKTKPKVPNTTEDGKDDPAGRAINRRTEFQIIGIKKSQ
jgi:outer membrane protein OmpA-like peptidoglycan-associated protein